MTSWVGGYTNNPSYPCTTDTYFYYPASAAGWSKADDAKKATLASITRDQKTATFSWSRPLTGVDPDMTVGEDLTLGVAWLMNG